MIFQQGYILLLIVCHFWYKLWFCYSKDRWLISQLYERLSKQKWKQFSGETPFVRILSNILINFHWIIMLDTVETFGAVTRQKDPIELLRHCKSRNLSMRKLSDLLSDTIYSKSWRLFWCDLTGSKCRISDSDEYIRTAVILFHMLWIAFTVKNIRTSIDWYYLFLVQRFTRVRLYYEWNLFVETRKI